MIRETTDYSSGSGIFFANNGEEGGKALAHAVYKVSAINTPMGKYNNPKNGQFGIGNRAACLSERNHAAKIYHALKELTTHELVQDTCKKLLAEGGNVARATLEMMLAYTIGKPVERLELSANNGQTVFNISTLSAEDQLALESITLKALQGEVVDVEAVVVQENTPQDHLENQA